MRMIYRGLVWLTPLIRSLACMKYSVRSMGAYHMIVLAMDKSMPLATGPGCDNRTRLTESVCQSCSSFSRDCFVVALSIKEHTEPSLLASSDRTLVRGANTMIFPGTRVT